jgi:O-antigen/teichoic acid export membrane protein
MTSTATGGDPTQRATSLQAYTAHLNFMKKQQWNVAYYAILLLAAVFAVKKAFDPPLYFVERWAGTLLCALVLVLSTLLLTFIHYDLGKARVDFGPDATAYTRDLRFTIPLWLSIFGAFCTVVWWLWRDCPCWAQ